MRTVFDKIIAGEIPAEVVYEDEHVLAFKDINPQAPVHVLVIPKVRVENFSQLAEADTRDIGVLFQKAAQVAALLGLEKKGYRLVVNCGRHGQQSVDYLHIHILGGRQMSWPPG